MKKIIIFGTSGMARETGDIAHALGLESWFVAAGSQAKRAWDRPEKVILEHEIPQFRDAEFAIGIGDNKVRRCLAKRFGDSLSFPSLIHPDASFGRRQHEAVAAQSGVIVCAGVRFTTDISIGNFCIFNLNATISHDVVIEDFVTVAPGANIAGNVHIGAGAWIGAGAVINQGDGAHTRRIGAGAVIGSGAVVTKDCDAGAVYVGVPAVMKP